MKSILPVRFKSIFEFNKKAFYFILSLITIFSINTQENNSFDPVIRENDYIFEKSDSGYDLYIKKKDNIESILLTEAQKDPQMKITNYGLRTTQFYEANGNEKRILDGKILQTKYDLFFLVDSTPSQHPSLGEVFHFFLPEKVIYGYDWAKKGEIEIKDGVEINIRMFEKKYTDYTGKFKDQWIKLKIKEEKNIYRPNLEKEIKDLSSNNYLKVAQNEKLEDVFLKKMINLIPVSQYQDIIFIIDTTLSMKEEFPAFVKLFPEIYKKIEKKCRDFKIGFIFYRDYGEKYLTLIYQPESDYSKLYKILCDQYVENGQDIPEAMYEAIYELNNINFRSNSIKTAILIADAPPHPAPRGKITKEDAINTIEKLNIKLKGIMFPF